jgi:hypothetical protein
VTVRVLPATVAGPEITVNVTPKPELEEATSEIGATPYVTGVAGAVKVIVCAAAFTTWVMPGDVALL